MDSQETKSLVPVHVSRQEDDWTIPPAERRKDDSKTKSAAKKPKATSRRKSVKKKPASRTARHKQRRDKREDVAAKERASMLIKRMRAQRSGYPKVVRAPVDIQKYEGEEVVFFRVEKWLNYKHLTWLTRIIPLRKLDEWTDGRELLNRHAEKLKAKVDYYNALDLVFQMEYDNKKKWLQRMVIIVALFALLIGLVSFVVPVFYRNRAEQFLAEGRYQNAYLTFAKAGNDSLTNTYKTYAEGFMLAEVGEYGRAQAALESIQGIVLSGVDNPAALDELQYRRGEYYEGEENYIEAASAFGRITDYKDARTCYAEMAYRAVDQLIENGNITAAIGTLQTIKNYKDASDRGIRIMAQLYNDASNAYMAGKMDNAKFIYEQLAPYNYKDAATMQYQTEYMTALHDIAAGEREKAKTRLVEIQDFKDAKNILAKLIYEDALTLVESDAKAAYCMLSTIPWYGDVADVLASPQFRLYGKWQVVEEDGVRVEGKSLSFDLDNTLEVSTAMRAIDYDDDGMKYRWSNGQYMTMDGQSSLTVEGGKHPELIVTARSGDAINQLTLHYKGSILDEAYEAREQISRALTDFTKQILEASIPDGNEGES